MENIGEVIGYITSHWQQIGAGILAVLGGFSVIAKITPWEWDDRAIGVITKAIRFLGLTKKKEDL